MKNKLLVIKLGGAVVTYKDSPTPKARSETIRSLSKEIKQLSKAGYKIILVHGAGSFAHSMVKKYNLNLGMKYKRQKYIFGKVIQRMLKLNGIIMGNLQKNGVAAVSLPPHTFITQTAGNLDQFEVSLIKQYLKKKIIPVLFGDMVLDDKWGCSVISGDTTVCYLAKKLKADQVIFLSDVDGIYDSDPRKNPKAKLIPEINNKNINQVLKGLSPTGRDDVTGEMQGKILAVKKDLKSIPTMVVNGLEENILIKSVHGEQIGTRLLFN